MTLVIPGVQVEVVKEVLPQQLAPSGVLGLVGFTEKELDKVERAASWTRFTQVCGAASAFSLPEARQALDNGVCELVISALKGGTAAGVAIPGKPIKLIALEAGPDGNKLKATVKYRPRSFDLTIEKEGGPTENVAEVTPETLAEKLKSSKLVKLDGNQQDWPPEGEYRFAGGEGNNSAKVQANGLNLVARASGPWGNQLAVSIKYRDNLNKAPSFDLSVHRPGGDDAGSEVFRDVKPETLAKKLEDGSQLVKADGNSQEWPAEGDYSFTGGTDANIEDYRRALVALEGEPDVDMVLAAVQEQDSQTLAAIYGAVIAHCDRMSKDCKGRIGFGQVPQASKLEDSTKLASNLASDRFVLLAPNGVVGAVAGKVGSLGYFHSPTFKTVAGLTALSPIALEEQTGLLKGNVVPVVLQRGKGVVVLRGLTTDGDQISVRRVADHAVRVMKMVGDLFIGLLNNADQRSALKQRLAAELIQMEKDGAIVPSTDGQEPAYKVEVYSSQDDFKRGIVRVNMAVRPVRAIDYIYATITIQG